MASRKPKETAVETEVVAEETAQVTEEVTVEAAEEIVEDTVEAEAPIAEKAEKTKKAKTTETEMTEAVKHTLEIFHYHEELYVTPAGNPFIKCTKLAQQQGAILYKNPYYKK
jgi:hypothetical protein